MGIQCLLRRCSVLTVTLINIVCIISPSAVNATLRSVFDNEVSTECSPGYTRCLKSNKCVHDLFFCDGDNDCGDNSDEAIAFCLERSCADDQVRCDNGQCIENKEFCSNQALCRDGSVRRNRVLCPNADPSFDMCLDVVLDNCAKSFSREWSGLDAWQLRQKFIETSMTQICSSVIEVKRCADNTINNACSAADVELMPDYYSQFRSDFDTVVDILCRQEINVINRHKACMFGRNSRRVDMFDMIEKCVATVAVQQRKGCESKEFQVCLIGEVRGTCGDEVVAAIVRHSSQVSYVISNYLVAGCDELETKSRGLGSSLWWKKS